MSSEEEHSPLASDSQAKRRTRRPYRSCDSCRHRKTRCDGLYIDGVITKCSHCLEFGLSCTYVKPVGQRGPKSKLVEELKQRIATLESKLRSLSICSICTQPLQGRPSRPSSPSIFQGTPKSDTTSTDGDQPPPEEDTTQDELVDRFRQLNVAGVGRTKLFATSSSYGLLGSALDEREKYLGRPPVQPVTLHSRRPLYWELLPWEKEVYDEQPSYVYPPRDLIASLLELYFANVHPTFPLLHRRSFVRSVAEGLHLTDTKFGATLLAVLALASRYSDDHRVLIDGKTSLSSGWKFVAQVQVVRKKLDVTIHDLQFYCLMTLLSSGTSAPQNCRLYLGIGLCFLEYRNQHYRPGEGQKFEDELWNRAFWSLFALDRMVCAFLGRPASIHLEDYKVEPPLEVDDEYWDDGITQPLGTPSASSFSVCISRLSEIMGDALRRLYSSEKRKTRMGRTGTDWEQSAVAELDSAMNAFLDSIPPHLRWDPERTGTFFDQSAILYVQYYYVQITIHRPYIHKKSPLAKPSLSICTGAARSALYIAHIWINRLQRVALPFLLNPVFVSALILLLNFFGSKRAGLAIDKRDLGYVGTALQVLSVAESRCHQSGRLLEMIQELLSSDICCRAPVNEAPSAYDDPSAETPGTALAWNAPPCVLPPARNLGPSAGAIVNEAYAQRLTFAPGMTIEELLAGTTVPDPSTTTSPESTWTNSVLDDEIMSMWMAAPTDLM
ncbi:fungal-specific transcription factor domain-containing protein [Mycena maculata]|uniref:Fungal-specific transcription factor domain-containing protein n=1 Tax=Mycena maculata TaxID=230809 RepID=A0AAD7HW74_9AGAR|nr:fungal-specific transcription factor domain-containing protein [Mycena maculata]